MEKKIKQILWIIGIILALLILNSYQKQNELVSMKVHYYLNGKEVFPEKSLKSLFSVVTELAPGQSYDAISFAIYGTNMGNVDLNMEIVNATPLVFKNALPATTQSLSKGETKILWTSNLMNTSQFESMAQPVRFWVNVSAGTELIKNYSHDYIDLMISGEGLVIFRTNVNQTIRYRATIYQSTQDDLDKTTDGNLKWIAFDKNGDGIMEKYGPTSSSTGPNRDCDSSQLSYGVLLYMPWIRRVCSSSVNYFDCDVWILNSTYPDRIGLCYVTTSISPGGSAIRWWQINATGAENAIITNESIQPYVLNRQERYR